jgi:hypothetical protein
MIFKQNSKSVTKAIAENAPFEAPSTEMRHFDTEGEGGQHVTILKNFAAAILTGKELIAPAAEGIHSVELANAMLLSGARKQTVDLPISSRSYANQLNKWMASSRYRPGQEDGNQEVQDVSKSWK